MYEAPDRYKRMMSARFARPTLSGVTTTVGSIRTVDWQRMQTNFFFVFPTGMLEDAPQMHVVMTRTETDTATSLRSRSP